MEKVSISLPGVARTCGKIESVLAGKIIDVTKHFHELDPKKCGLISDERFFTIIYNQLGHEFGVCQEEVKELGDYFKKQGGKVDYKEFLEIVLPKNIEEKPLTTTLEWEDHDHVNVLSPFELRQLELILTKIAISCKIREVYLEPLFEDYERTSKNNGTITVQHFRRLLYFAGITLGSKEFQIIMKRFIKFGYTVNYVAFLEAIRNINDWCNEHNTMENFPGNIINAEIDKLPRPEIGKIDISATIGTAKSCHPFTNQFKKPDIKFYELMLRIKKHVLDNRVRTREFFEKFDMLKTGFITKSQFYRGLDAIGLSGLHRLYVSTEDLEKVFRAYNDNWDDLMPDRVKWMKFCDDLDEVFTIKCLDKQPYRLVESPPLAVKELPRPGTADWENVPKTKRQRAQDTIFRLRNIIKSRNIDIETFFKSFDKSNHFHVTRCQMRRVFSSNSILLSDKEVEALMLRYGDDMGFNYWKFLEEINSLKFCKAKHKEILKLLKIVNVKNPLPCSQPKFSVVEVLAKIKGQATRNRINMDQFMNQRDKLKEGMIPEAKFRAGFAAAGIILEECELDLLCKACQHPCHPGFMKHELFCDFINQAFYQTKLEKRPLTVPIKHLPSPDDSLNFLDFEERCIISNALQKLSRYHDDASNIQSFFEDRCGVSGIVSKQMFEQVLSVCGVFDLVTPKEIEILFKGFSLPAGPERKFDYKSFIMVLTRISSM